MSANPSTVNDKDLRFLQAATTLGGAITTTEFSDNILHNFFPFITDEVADEGATIYWPFYVKNVDKVGDIINPRLLIFNDTVSTWTTIAVGWDPAPINQSLQTIANQNTPPTGIKWSDSPDPTKAASLGVALPRNGGYCGAWLRLKVTAGAQEIKFDGCQLFILTDNLPGDAPDTVTTNLPPDVDIIHTGGTGLNNWWKKILENIMYKNASWFVHLGNIFGDHTTNPPTNSHSFTSFFPPILRKRTHFTFGINEAFYPIVKNGIRDFFGYNRTYYSHIEGNVHKIFLDTSDPVRMPYGEGSEQLEWFVKELQRSLSLNQVDWRIVYCNRAMYGATTSPAAKKFLDPTLRDFYHPPMELYKVHVCIQSGFNNFQRLHLLEYNTEDPTDPITKQTDELPNYEFIGQGFDKGVLFFNVGMGGGTYDNIANSPAYVSYADSTRFGDFDVKAVNRFWSQDRLLKMVFRNLTENEVDVSTITNNRSSEIPPDE